MSIDVAFIGLGVMGREMARHLIGAGHRVRVFNRTTSKAEAFVAVHGGTLADSPISAARGADVVLTSCCASSLLPLASSSQLAPTRLVSSRHVALPRPGRAGARPPPGGDGAVLPE